MTITDVKQIHISDYLHSLGYNPIKQQGGNLWYKSPFRQEKEPSFKVNTELNLWYDFGAGKGGNIIALAQELYASDDLRYLLERIVQQAPHVRPVSFSFAQQSPSQPSFQHLGVHDLVHPALLRYLHGRGINIGLAKRNAKNSISSTTGNPISPSVFQMWLVVMKYVILFSKAASHQKTSPTYGNKENRKRNVWCSRA